MTAPDLQTPTDLKSNETKSVAQALNAALADSYALYLKTKNFHWHVSGPHFRDYHLMFDEQATQILGTTDAIAEVIRSLPAYTRRANNRSRADLINLAFLGTAEELKHAFGAAGWCPRIPSSLRI